MARGEVAATEPKIDLVYPIGVNDGKRAGAFLWTRTCVSRVMSKLHPLPKISQGILSEKCTRPFLQTR